MNFRKLKNPYLFINWEEWILIKYFFSLMKNNRWTNLKKFQRIMSNNKNINNNLMSLTWAVLISSFADSTPTFLLIKFMLMSNSVLEWTLEDVGVIIVVVVVWKASLTHESPICFRGELHWHLPNRFGIRKSQWLSTVQRRQWALL